MKEEQTHTNYPFLKEPVRITDQHWDDQVLPLVSIRCLTYMHENYIRDAIEGFLMQKTTFKVEIWIHDDASTDRTPDIMREYEAKYPQLFVATYQIENQHMKNPRTPKWIKPPQRKGKYIAECEGDDYWTDPLKLQKQVEFLEGNEEYGLVHSDFDVFDTVKKKYSKNHWKSIGYTNQSGDIYNTLFANQGSGIFTATVCYRKSLTEDINRNKFSKYKFGDLPLWLHIASKSKIGYLSESTAVRNVLPYSATQGQSFEYSLEFANSGLSAFNDFDAVRPFDKSAKEKFYVSYHNQICEICYRHRENYALFFEHYKKIDKNFLSKELKIKKWLFRFGVNSFLSKLLLKFSRNANA